MLRRIAFGRLVRGQTGKVVRAECQGIDGIPAPAGNQDRPHADDQECKLKVWSCFTEKAKTIRITRGIWPITYSGAIIEWNLDDPALESMNVIDFTFVSIKTAPARVSQLLNEILKMTIVDFSG
jgi:hypothetical protein